MPVIRFPALMKYYVDNQTEFQMDGSSVGQVIQNILVKYPGLRPHLFDTKGELRRHFNIFVNGVHIRDLNGMDTTVAETDKVIFMASAAGG
jgi:adenylyltransferase/sulfurtransferase